VLLESGRYDEAEQAFAHALRVQPGNEKAKRGIEAARARRPLSAP